MDNVLREQFIKAMMRFKRIDMMFPPDINIRMAELMVLNSIAKHCEPCGDECLCGIDKKIHVSDLHSKHEITKPAVSQILSGLEKKGYIVREIEKSDRRKIAVGLTKKGCAILEISKDYVNNIMDKTISKFGEDNMQKLIELFTQLSDILYDVKKETLSLYGKDMTADD